MRSLTLALQRFRAEIAQRSSGECSVPFTSGHTGLPSAAIKRSIRVSVLLCLLTIGCMPEERLNNSCRWTDVVMVLPSSGDPARRTHLVEDVRVAQWLGIRHGDVVVGRIYNDEHRRARAQCTEAMLSEIQRRHGVSSAELVAVTGAREWWIDLVAVFLPMAALFLVLSRATVRHVLAGYDATDRAFAIGVLAVIWPLAAGFGVGFTHMWAWLVETMRLRDNHISYRVGYLPVGRHAWLIWGIAMGLFAVVAARVIARNDIVSRTGPRTRRLFRVPTRG
jgi:hypothetical protein